MSEVTKNLKVVVHRTPGIFLFTIFIENVTRRPEEGSYCIQMNGVRTIRTSVRESGKLQNFIRVEEGDCHKITITIRKTLATGPLKIFIA